MEAKSMARVPSGKVARRQGNNLCETLAIIPPHLKRFSYQLQANGLIGDVQDFKKFSHRELWSEVYGWLIRSHLAFKKGSKSGYTLTDPDPRRCRPFVGDIVL
jgi:hypothetical protein